MEISSHYSEVLVLLHGLFKYMFAELESPRFAREMAAIRAVYPSAPAAITDEPLVVPWGQAMDMLANAGVSVGPLDDLTGAAELRLGELVKEKYSSDFFILGKASVNGNVIINYHCYTDRFLCYRPVSVKNQTVLHHDESG